MQVANETFIYFLAILLALSFFCIFISTDVFRRKKFARRIELIENQKLYEAVKNLSIEDQIFISYIVKEGRTQREMENIYKVDHRNIGCKFNNIIKELGCTLCKR